VLEEQDRKFVDFQSPVLQQENVLGGLLSPPFPTFHCTQVVVVVGNLSNTFCSLLFGLTNCYWQACAVRISSGLMNGVTGCAHIPPSSFLHFPPSSSLSIAVEQGAEDDGWRVI
jgi:hypothetical protein